MNKIFTLLVTIFFYVGAIKAQNVGIGVATPTHKLHVIRNVPGGNAIYAYTGGSANYSAVAGESDVWHGGWFQTDYVNANPGISGVLGRNDAASTNAVGVRGLVGASLTTSASYDFRAVYGQALNTTSCYGYGGYFVGEWAGVYGINPSGGNTCGMGVYYSGDLAGSGAKSCVMRTTQGPRLLYCVESPEIYFEDFGTAEIKNGTAEIVLDDLFLEVVTINEEFPIKVFVTPGGMMGNNWWVEKKNNGFILHAPQAAQGTPFDWRIVAKRKGYEHNRMEFIPAYDDPYLYPNPEDPEIPEEWREKARNTHKLLNNPTINATKQD